MTIWLFVISLLFISSFLEAGGQKKILVAKKLSLNKLVFFSIAVFLLLLASLRFETGRDWGNYLRMYRYDKIETTSVERGYIGMNVFFRNLNMGDKGFYLMQFFVMSFCCAVVYTNIYKNNEFPIFILLIYFTSYFFNTELAQTRQHIAMAILICGNRFIRERKIVRWLLIVILAMQFHITAVMAFPLYFTERIHVPLILAFVLLAATLVLNLMGFNFVWVMLNVAVKLSFIPERIASLLNRYMHSEKYGQQAEYSSGLGLIVRYGFYFICIFLWGLKDKDARKKYHFPNFLIAVYFLSLGRNFDQFGRIANYYFICGNGLSFYDVMPSSIKFFRKVDFGRLFLTVLYAVLIISDFVRAYTDCLEYSYRSVLFHNF